jgi:phosphorylcholine metabolism protein LicD
MTHIEYLMDVLNFLDQNQIEYALFCGTLLGCMRDNAFLPGDNRDTDIIIDEKYQTKVIELLETAIHNKRFTWYRKWRKEVSIESWCTTFKVDIFFVEFQDNKMYLYSYGFNPSNSRSDSEFRIVFHKNDIFPSIEHTFLGHKVKIPQDWEIVLATHYGNWRIPDPNFDSTKPPNRDYNYQEGNNV